LTKGAVCVDGRRSALATHVDYFYRVTCPSAPTRLRGATNRWRDVSVVWRGLALSNVLETHTLPRAGVPDALSRASGAGARYSDGETVSPPLFQAKV